VFDPFLTEIHRQPADGAGGAVRFDLAVPCGGLVRLTRPGSRD
jgi:hypothetical protein